MGDFEWNQVKFILGISDFLKNHGRRDKNIGFVCRISRYNDISVSMILGMVYHAGLLNYMLCVRPNERLIRLTILYLMDDTTFTRIKMESVSWMVEVSARSL